MMSAPSYDLEKSLMQTVRYSMGGKITSIVEAADLLGVSVRKLQYDLKKAGYVYRDLVSRARFEETRKLLLRGDRNLREVSEYLGYRHRANFNHACREWTGMNPSEYAALLQKRRS